MFREHTGFILAAIGLVAASLPLPAAAVDVAEARRITVEQKPIAALPVPPASSLSVGVWTDRSDGLYVPGEELIVYFRVNEPAYVTVYNVDATGLVTVLFPNKNSPNNHVGAAGVVAIPPAANAPYVLRVSAPYGSNLIKVVATDSAKPLVALDAADVFVSGRAQEMARRITVVQAEAPSAKWAMAQHVIGVVSARPGQTVAGGNPVAPVAPVAPAPGTTTVVVPPGQQVVVQGGQDGTPVAPVPVAPPAPPAVQPVVVVPDLGNLSTGFFLTIGTDKESYRPGDEMRVSVTAERDCSLTLVNVNPDGSYGVIYPNKRTEEVKLKAGRAIYLPPASGDDSLRASGPAGRHQLLAICSYKQGFFDWLFGRSGERAALTTATAPAPPLASILEGSDDADEVGRKAAAYTVLGN